MTASVTSSIRDRVAVQVNCTQRPGGRATLAVRWLRLELAPHLPRRVYESNITLDGLLTHTLNAQGAVFIGRKSTGGNKVTG